MSQPVNSNGNVTTPAPAPQIPTQAQPGPVSAPPSPQYPPQRLAAAQPQPTQPQYYSPYATQQYPVYGQPLGSPSGFVMPADGQQFLGLLQTRDTAGLNGLALQVAAGGQFAIAQQATTQALNVLNHAQALGAQAQIPGGVMPFVAQAAERQRQVLAPDRLVQQRPIPLRAGGHHRYRDRFLRQRPVGPDRPDADLQRLRPGLAQRPGPERSGPDQPLTPFVLP
jgi:hypothetical protein